MTYALNETILKVENVSWKKGDNVILRDINAEIRNITRPNTTTGQVVGFLGLSGTGKTSLFRLIAGLEAPTTGTITLHGKPVKAGDVGVVQQSYPLFPHLTVFDNLLLAAKRQDVKTAKERVWAFLKEFSLEDKASFYPARLSGGQRQRCAIGQQVLNSEHFLLLDEPFSGLDLLMEEKTCELLSKVAHRSDLNTVIVITHDITAAATIADHLWVLGKEQGKPGARIVREYNLIERGLCWQPGIAVSPRLTEFVREVKEDFRKNAAH
jgi:polar amino acid transport system ATP-binding protein/sulfate transport system ATP-binding protein